MRTLMSLLHVVYARAAADIASSSCSFVHSGTWAKTCPVAGLITPAVDLPFTALPSIVIVYSAIGNPPSEVCRESSEKR